MTGSVSVHFMRRTKCAGSEVRTAPQKLKTEPQIRKASPSPRSLPMREFIRPIAITLSVACLAASMAVLPSNSAMAQAKGGQMAPAPAAAPMDQPPPVKQIALTDKQVESVIAAAKDMDALAEKVPQDGKPDPKLTAQFD